MGPLRLLVLVAALVLAPACGALRFQRAWASHEPRAGDELDGRWRGEWRSEWNGHSGGLRCLTTRADGGHLRAWFYSTYASILFFQYELLLRVERTADGTFHFAGEQDLGAAIGGVYRYEGTLHGDGLHATFRADNGDHGVFELRRVR